MTDTPFPTEPREVQSILDEWARLGLLPKTVPEADLMQTIVIEHNRIHARLPRCDCRGEPGRTAPNDHQFSLGCHGTSSSPMPCWVFTTMPGRAGV